MLRNILLFLSGLLFSCQAFAINPYLYGNKLPGGSAQAVASTAEARLEAQGFEPDGGTPAAFAAYIKSEIGKWAQVIKTAGIAAE